MTDKPNFTPERMPKELFALLCAIFLSLAAANPSYACPSGESMGFILLDRQPKIIPNGAVLLEVSLRSTKAILSYGKIMKIPAKVTKVHKGVYNDKKIIIDFFIQNSCESFYQDPPPEVKFNKIEGFVVGFLNNTVSSRSTIIPIFYRRSIDQNYIQSEY
jgi:hypothetical protein